MASCCMVNWELIFSSLPNCWIILKHFLHCFPNMKIRQQLDGTRPIFMMFSDNPNVILGIVDCSLYTLRIAHKNDYHKRKKGHSCMYSCAIQLFVDSKSFLSFLPDKTSSSKKTSNNAPIRRIAIAMTKLCFQWIIHGKSFPVSTIWS